MNCPKCGVDIDLYLKQKAKEEKFEQTYGKQLRPIRWKRALIGGAVIALLFVCGSIFFMFLCDLFVSSSFRPIQFFGEALMAFSGDPFFSVLFSCFCLVLLLLIYVFWLPVIRSGKQEKEFRKSFGL